MAEARLLSPPLFILPVSKTMPRPKMLEPRKRTTIYLRTDLLLRFKHHYKDHGDFSTLLNDLLRVHLEGLDSGEKEMEKAKRVAREMM